MATNSSLNIECGEGIIEDADNFPVLFDNDDAAHSRYVRKTQTRFVSIDTNTKTTFVFVSGLCHFLF